jgi:Tfp pilus assembly protein PilX
MFMNNSFGRSKSNAGNSAQRGIALVTTLLLLIMLSALAMAFVLAVNTENRMQSTDKGNTTAYYGTEAGMEKAMLDLNSLYQSMAAPTVSQIQGLSAPATCTSNCPFPTIPGISYKEYSFTAFPDPKTGQPRSWSSTVSAGPNQGLIANVIPITLAVTSQAPGTEEVRMLRNVEVALIPVFQFGVFSSTDLDTFAGPPMEIGGRVQTNGDLYLAAGNGGDTVFRDKVLTAKEVVRDTLANGSSMSTHTGTVEIPTAPQGCDGSKSNCRTLSYLSPNDESSWLNGVWPDIIDPFGNKFGGKANGSWGGVSKLYSGFLMSHIDGVKPLNLPFVKAGVSDIEILRRPQTGDSMSLQDSRLYNKAQIRVLLDDDPNFLPNGAGDADNVRLANVGTFATGVPVPAGTTYFAEGTTKGILTPPPPATALLADPNWVLPNADTGGVHGSTGMSPTGAPLINATDWNLLDGWLRVEVRQTDGSYLPVTREWLKLGFARGNAPPMALGNNVVNPDAILIFQQLALRSALIPVAGTPFPNTTAKSNDLVNNTYYGSNGRNNYYPINMYDTREGETRELTNPNSGLAWPLKTQGGNFGCSVNGVINLTEIDVGNLQRWLLGTTGANGKSVENQTQNGYVLYFSDHRGMVPQDTAPSKTLPPFAMLGSYGFEDVINPGTTQGTPNNALDGGEEVEVPGDPGSMGNPQTQGSANLGLGFGFKPMDLAPTAFGGKGGNGTTDEVFTRLPKCDIGRANWVSGARHGVRLVDGGPGNLPQRPNANPNNKGGFTVATDNALYVLGNYNASAAGWDNPPPPSVTPQPGQVNYPHASAAAIADTVTLLSNAWLDLNSFATPGSTTGNRNKSPKISGRIATDTYYRLAIASGKNVDFTQPAYSSGGSPIGGTPTDLDNTATVAGVPSDFGTDGGIHNFLRYLETWQGIQGDSTYPAANSYYSGSMVSLYYSEYATGVFKCCGTVYQPPSRHYDFDTDFKDITQIPPGSPRFQEVINVGYKQDLSYR